MQEVWRSFGSVGAVCLIAVGASNKGITADVIFLVGVFLYMLFFPRSCTCKSGKNAGRN